MVLLGIVGELGSGKTTTMVYLAWKNWFFRKKKIYANLHLFKIPYIYINRIPQMASMKEGVCVFDEMWRICDSRLSKSEMNKISSDILSRSRKRHLTYIFTAQIIDSIDKRIRKVIDFTALPIMNPNETVCKVLIFRSGYPKEGMHLKTIYFKTPLIFKCFDTDEEIDMLVEEDYEEPKIIFQENYNPSHGYLCECKECGTKFFDTWEEADSYAENYWRSKKISISEIL